MSIKYELGNFSSTVGKRNSLLNFQLQRRGNSFIILTTNPPPTTRHLHFPRETTRMFHRPPFRFTTVSTPPYLRDLRTLRTLCPAKGHPSRWRTKLKRKRKVSKITSSSPISHTSPTWSPGNYFGNFYRIRIQHQSFLSIKYWVWTFAIYGGKVHRNGKHTRHTRTSINAPATCTSRTKLRHRRMFHLRTLRFSTVSTPTPHLRDFYAHYAHFSR